ncbi:MAG: hypothetical protein AAGK21_13925 [Bacteroidota bacterium]
MRSRVVLLLSLLTFTGCSALADLNLDVLAEAIEITPADDPSDGEPPPPPTAAGDPNRPTIPSTVRRASPTMVTTEMLAAAAPIGDRVLRETAGARSFDDRVTAIRNFRPTAAERERVRVLGFQTITVEAGGGGNSPYLVGASLSQGIAIGLTPGDPVYALTGGGFSLGVPGAGADIRIGFWRADVANLAGWSLGVNGSAVGPHGVGVGVGVFWDFGDPMTFSGFNVGAAFSSPGGDGDGGLAWTEYTQQIIDTVSDAGRILAGGATQNGAPLGGSCRVGTDCRGYRAPVGSRTAGVACCNGTCQQTKKDYAGISWCPAVCRSGPFRPGGTC